MHRVGSFANLFTAVLAADELVSRGIVARVVGDREAFGGLSLWGRGSFDVAVLNKGEVEPARAVVAAMSPPDAGEIQWDVPDLTRLDPGLAPNCPGCGHSLPLRAECEACPACGMGVDVPELIAERHGPEALAACYDDAGEEKRIDDRLLLTARLHCTRCRYCLEGLPIEGHCPECGREYDKREIVRAMLAV